MNKARYKAFLHWLEGRLNQAAGTMLPKDTELARRWNISTRTLGFLIRPYVDSGQLLRAKRRGTMVGPLSDLVIPISDRRPSYRRLFETLQRCIALRELRPGDFLPKVSYCSAKYHVSRSTVERAYLELVQVGCVQKIGKRYFVGSISSPVQAGRALGTVLFVVPDMMRAEDIYTDYYGPAFQSLEAELRWSRYRVETMSQQEYLQISRDTQHSFDYKGIVLCRAVQEQILPLKQATARLGWRMGSVRLPIVVECTSSVRSNFGPDSIVFSFSWLRRYMIRNLIPYLATLDATSACLVNLYSHSEGMLPLYKMELQFALPSLRVAIREQQVGSQLWERRPWPGTGSLPAYAGAYLARFPEERQSDLVLRDTLAACTYIDSVHSNTTARLWIACSDDTAALLVTWAKMRGLKVPQELRIISLFNDPRLIHHGITTLDPDWQRLGSLMAHHIVGDVLPPRHDGHYLYSGGRLLLRDTA